MAKGIRKYLSCNVGKSVCMHIGLMVAAFIYVLQGETIIYASEGINVDYHNEGEIKAYYDSCVFYDGVTYSQTPVTTAPYASGRLSNETMQGALDMLNFIRYVAGISYHVTLNDEYSRLVQTGTLLNAVNGRMEHAPAKPANMSDDLYQAGYTGTSSANLGWGYQTLTSTIKDGWMAEEDSINITILGHRRWILNPAMKMTGFGKTDLYTAMYVFDSFGAATDKYGVAWPAQVMPTSFFSSNSPWSISMGYDVDYNSVNVKLTCITNGKTWSFSKSHADGELYVDNQWYGVPGCIIFRPNGIGCYNPGDVYKVEITGLRQNVSYEVKFFDLNSVTASSSYSGNTYLGGSTSTEQYVEVTEPATKEYYDTNSHTENDYQTENIIIEPQTIKETVAETTIEETTQEITSVKQDEESESETQTEEETEKETTKAKKVIKATKANYYYEVTLDEEDNMDEEEEKYQKKMSKVSNDAMVVAFLAALTGGVMSGVTAYKNKHEE